MTSHEDTPQIPVMHGTVTRPGPWDRVQMDNDEPLPDAMQRLTISQFDRMIDALTNPDMDRDTGIHIARKAMKRLRGLLRLVRDEIDGDVFRAENVLLRDQARRLAPVRDAYVLMVTFDHVAQRYGKLHPSGDLSETATYVRGKYKEALRSVFDDPRLIDDVVATLAAARTRFADGSILVGTQDSLPIRDDFDVIAGGLRRVYRRGWHGYTRSAERGTTEAFHEWRKRVKYLQYQVEALGLLQPAALEVLEFRLSELGKTLGAEHDLAVLANTVAVDPRACSNPDTRRSLLRTIDGMRSDLQKEAVTLGGPLFHDDTRDFVETMRTFWTSARAGS